MSRPTLDQYCSCSELPSPQIPCPAENLTSITPFVNERCVEQQWSGHHHCGNNSNEIMLLIKVGVLQFHDILKKKICKCPECKASEVFIKTRVQRELSCGYTAHAVVLTVR